MDLQQFMSAFPQGFQQNNRFTCKFVFGGKLEELMSAHTDFASMCRWMHEGIICDTTRLPSRAFDQVPLTLYGVTEQFPTKTEYTPLECTFLTPLVGARNILPEFFTLWMNQIQSVPNGMSSTRDMGWPQDYYGSIELSTYDRENNTSLTYYFENVYPKSMEGMGVSWSEESEMTRLSVAFTYSTWKLLPFTPPLVKTLPSRQIWNPLTTTFLKESV